MEETKNGIPVFNKTGMPIFCSLFWFFSTTIHILAVNHFTTRCSYTIVIDEVEGFIFYFADRFSWFLHFYHTILIFDIQVIF